jgi:hypothetical protein
MKKTVFSIALIFAMAGLMAQSGGAVKSDVVFKDARIALAYNSYLQLKDALVASKPDAAKEAAIRLKTSLGSLKNNNPDRHRDAMNEATKIATASTIEDIRKTFASLSTEMTTIVKGGQLSKGILYLEYCPMANNNNGGYWLSNEKEIKNPYFGDKMLKCGSIKEMIH